MNRKNIIPLLAMLLLLNACSKQQENISAVPIESLAEQTPDKVTMGESTDKIIIDAEISLPSESRYGSYSVQPKCYTEEDALKIKDILIGEADTDYSLTGRQGRRNYCWENESCFLSVNESGSSIGFDTNFSNYILNVFLPPTSKGITNSDLFTQKELDFCTRQQAVSDTKQFLAECGITVSDNAQVYSLCQTDLQNAMDLYKSDLSFYPFETQYYPEYAQKSDECYYIKFNAEQDGIPLYNSIIKYKTIPDFFVQNPEINAIYSSDGIKYLMVLGYCGDISLSEELSELITAEAAAKAALGKYAEVVTDSNIKINEIELMYVYQPIKDSSKYLMCPAYICSGTIKKFPVQSGRGDTASSYTETVTVIIDAVTGKEII